MALSKIDVANMVENQMPQANLADNINFRNIIINGDMSVAQRATSKSALGTGFNTVDRFETLKNVDSAFTESQSTDVPSGQGFSNSWKIECTTADASPDADYYLSWRQPIEAQMLKHLKYGTSSAESTTLSFWIKSSKTGTYVVILRNMDNSRLIAQTYTISSADTWEKKELTFVGDTSSGFNNDNGEGLRVQFQLVAGSDYTSGTLQTTWGTYANANSAAGQVNFGDSTSNNLYITGVQYEAGTSASDFEFLPHDVNLRRCQRYYQTMTLVRSGSYYASTSAAVRSGQTSLPTYMRTNASITFSSQGYSNASGLTVDGTDEGHFNTYVTTSGAGGFYWEANVVASAEL